MYKFLINKCFLTRLTKHTRTADWSHGSVTQRSLETRHVSTVVEITSSGARLPGFDLDSVTLKSLWKLSVPQFLHLLIEYFI